MVIIVSVLGFDSLDQAVDYLAVNENDVENANEVIFSNEQEIDSIFAHAKQSISEAA